MRDADRGRLSPSSLTPGPAGQTREVRRRRQPVLLGHPGLFTFLRVLSRRMLMHTAVLVMLVLGLVLGTQAPIGRDPLPPEPEVPWQQAEVLIQQYGCWTGEAPPGVQAGHAVVALPSGPARVVPAMTGFEIWLGRDGIPHSGDERPGLVFAFCP